MLPGGRRLEILGLAGMGHRARVYEVRDLAGTDRFALGWGQTVTLGTEPAFTNITTGGVPLTSSLGVSGMFDFDVMLQSPTLSNDFTEQEIVATVTAQFP